MTRADNQTNPLLNVTFSVPFDAIEPRHAEEAVDQLIARARRRLESLTAGEPTGQFLQDLDDLTRDLEVVVSIVGHLESVVAGDWREAYRAILPRVSAFDTELTLSEPLWRAARTFSDGPGRAGLGAEQARFLSLTLERFRRNGVDLPPERKERLKAIDVQLAELTNAYERNVVDGIGAFELYVGEDRLAGVPQRARDMARAEAEKRGQDGYRLSLHLPLYEPVLTYAEDRSLRRELWEAYNRRGVGEGRDNRPLIVQILRLRREKAELLGFENFADLVLAERMASTGERALAFERDLAARLRPHFEREQAELEAFYREQAGQDAPSLQAWDVGYWAEKQRQARYDLDEEQLRPYFPLDRVVDGLFEISRRVFGVRVEEASAAVWHPDVKYYNLYNRDGEHVSSFYTDWFPRDGKRGGAWARGFITGKPTVDGFAPHLGVMVGNLTPPVGDTPALLSHREVETVFHEFGHMLHRSLSRVRTRNLAATNVPRDFVELPSQIMENWCWEREALDLFAGHYRTGERLPQGLFERLTAARNYRAAEFAMRQLGYGMQDLMLHVVWDERQDVIEFARGVAQQFMPVPLPQEYYFIAGFPHVFGSPVGYASGYYSYLWSEVLDADAFSRFAEAGVFNEVVGAQFVSSVLSRGNSADAAELFREFMGREPDAAALLRRLGMEGTPNPVS